MRLLISFLILFSNKAFSKNCSDAIKSTKKICATAQILNQVATLISAWNMSKSSAIFEACSKAAQLNQLSAIGNSAFASTCGSSARLCKESCSSEKGISVCDNYESIAILAKTQSIVSLAGFSKSKACAEISKSNLSSKESKTVALNSKEIIPIIASSLDLKDISNGEFDYSGNFIEKTENKINPVNPSSETFVSGGKGSSAIVGDYSTEKSVSIDSDILLPGSQQIVSDLEANKSGYQEGNSNLKREGEGIVIDLKDFLPKGENDFNRKTASEMVMGQIISPANGLSNFEKVSRKINDIKWMLAP